MSILLDGTIQTYGGASVADLQPFFYFTPQGTQSPKTRKIQPRLPANGTFGKGDGTDVLFTGQLGEKYYTVESKELNYAGLALDKDYDVYFVAKKDQHVFWSETPQQLRIMPADDAVPQLKPATATPKNPKWYFLQLTPDYKGNPVNELSGMIFLPPDAQEKQTIEAVLGQITPLMKKKNDTGVFRESLTRIAKIFIVAWGRALDNTSLDHANNLYERFLYAYFKPEATYTPYFFQTSKDGKCLFMSKPGKVLTIPKHKLPTTPVTVKYEDVFYKINFQDYTIQVQQLIGEVPTWVKYTGFVHDLLYNTLKIPQDIVKKFLEKQKNN